MEAETEQGGTLFHIRNSLILNKGLKYMSATPKGETEGVLTFVVPVGQCCMALNGVHHDAGHQGQQRTLALTQERFLVAHDGQRLPGTSESMPMLSEHLREKYLQHCFVK